MWIKYIFNVQIVNFEFDIVFCSSLSITQCENLMDFICKSKPIFLAFLWIYNPVQTHLLEMNSPILTLIFVLRFFENCSPGIFWSWDFSVLKIPEFLVPQFFENKNPWNFGPRIFWSWDYPGISWQSMKCIKTPK